MSAGRYAACTIVSKNYISYARVLAESFRRHHPDAGMYVLLVDRLDGHFDPAAEPFTLVELSALGIPDLPRFAFQYAITELNTAVKPYFLRHLLREHGLHAYDVEGTHVLARDGRVQRANFWHGVDRVMRKMSDLDGDRSVATFLAARPGGRSLVRARAALREFVQGFHAADLRRISVRSIAPEKGEDASAFAQRVAFAAGSRPVIAGGERVPLDVTAANTAYDAHQFVGVPDYIAAIASARFATPGQRRRLVSDGRFLREQLYGRDTAGAA